jgi:glycosyltransferase domain-containing protein
VYFVGGTLLDRASILNITIIIPSYERASYLTRQVEYWEGTHVQLIMLDGSRNPCQFKMPLPDNILYIHMPESIEKRLKYASTLIKTDYAALLSDDEFFLQSGVEACINFLEENKDFVSCKGAALGFEYRSGLVMSSNVYPDLRAENSITDQFFGDRISSHLSPYLMATLWAVMRKDVFVATLRSMGAGGPYASAAVGEVQTSLLTSYFGKCKVLNILFWLRSYENKNIWWSFGRESFCDWYLNPSNLAEVEFFFSSMESELTAEMRVAFRKQAMRAIDAYVNDIRAQDRSAALHSLRQTILRLLKAASMLYKVSRAAARGFFGVVGKNPLEDTALKLEAQGILINRAELQDIHALVGRFHRGLK